MKLKIDKIILTKEVRRQQNLPIADDSTDVIVKMKNGAIYLACFFSYDSIEKYRQIHKKKNQFLGGKYFWSKGMLLIEDCVEGSIKQVVKDLINEGDFLSVFECISKKNDFLHKTETNTQ